MSRGSLLQFNVFSECVPPAHFYYNKEKKKAKDLTRERSFADNEWSFAENQRIFRTHHLNISKAKNPCQEFIKILLSFSLH